MSDRIEELNQRIFSRVQTSNTPSILFSPRPVPTKYVRMPIVIDPTPPKTSLELRDRYVDFLPTDSKGPGALDFVDVESTLKNMDFALQRDGRAQYVPSSQSSLYKPPQNNHRGPSIQQPYPNLFAHVVSKNNGIPPNLKPATSVFNNVKLRTPV
jgi:hypothetical protein